MTVRVKLTLLFGLLFLIAGAALVGISYQLVAHNVPEGSVIKASGNDVVLRADKLAHDLTLPENDRAILAKIAAQTPDQALEAANAAGTSLTPAASTALLKALPGQVRSDALHQLLVQSSIALGIAALVSIALGWIVAGRVLRPLSRVTETAQRLSASNLDERIDLQGPDDELTRLANTFDAMLDRLAASFEGQRRFVANASHELRTPLTIMAAELDVTLRRPDASVDELRRMGATVRTAVDRSDRLITSLLALARVERGLEITRNTDLAIIATEALQRRAEELAESSLKLRTSLGQASVIGDPGLLDRLVDNLLDNAIRHNIEGGWVQITTCSNNGDAEVEVASSGAVLSPDAVAGLFVPFRRLDPRTGSQRNMGLGLSIVQAIAHAHGGTASAIPIETGGLTVQVQMKAATDDAPPDDPRPPTA